jgi:hypothetical protein
MNNNSKSMKTRLRAGRLDQLGMVASLACAIHCAALPLVATLLPLLGLEFLANPTVEMVMIGLSLIIGIWSLTGSYPLHKKRAPMLVLLAGFSFIALGHFLFETAEAVLIPIGGFTIAAAHYLNWRGSRPCKHDN